MRVAVTGARGFIGSHLVTHLRAEGHEVLGLGRDAGGLLVPVDADPGPVIPLEEALAGMEGVVHLAARRVDRPQTPFADYVGPNVLLTEDLLRVARAAGVRRFVLASSRMVYPSWLQGAITEDCPHRPDTFYGLSKRVAEDLLALHTASGAMSAAALRVGQVVGSGDGDRGVLPRFVADAARGRPLRVTGAGEAVRDFVDVRDVVRAFASVLVTTSSAPAFNIGGPRAHSIAEMARAVAAAAGLGPDGVQHDPTEDEDRSHYSLDRGLALAELGWAPEHSLDDTVRFRLAEERAASGGGTTS